MGWWFSCLSLRFFLSFYPQRNKWQCLSEVAEEVFEVAIEEDHEEEVLEEVTEEDHEEDSAAEVAAEAPSNRDLLIL